ncbi:hypothetical protein GQR58_026620 [Nymphon striatum]|nr:hypothetical protein GQR58_026620 [Nymphon striatum]
MSRKIFTKMIQNATNADNGTIVCSRSPFYESSSEDLLLDNAQTNSSWFESIHTSLNGFNLNSSSIIHSIVWGEQSLANCNLPIQFVSNYFVSVLKCRLKLLN